MTVIRRERFLNKKKLKYVDANPATEEVIYKNTHTQAMESKKKFFDPT